MPKPTTAPCSRPRRRASEARHRVTLLSIGDGVITTDAEGRVELLNPAAEALTGWRQEEACGWPLEEVFRIINEETRQPVEDPVRRVVREGIVVGLANHTLLITRDGVERPIADSGAPVRDPSGATVGVVLVFRDQTAERKAQAALRESEEHYRSLIEHMLNGFAYCRMIFDQDRPVDFTYLNVNRAFEALTGLKDVVGKNVSEVIPGIRESDPELFEIYGRVARTGVPERIETYVAALQMWFWISVYSPRKEHFVAVFDVITERKRAEEALKASEEHYRSVTQSANDAIITADSAGKIITWNQGATRMFGYSESEALGQSLAILMPESSRALHKAGMQRLQGGGEPHIIGRTVELSGVRKGGEEFPIELSLATWESPQGPVYTGILRDTTERKRAEEEREKLQAQLLQAQKMESVGRLAGGVAHDFNNMLQAIMGNADLALLQAEPGSDLAESLLEIQAGAQRSADLTRQLLAFARKQTVSPARLDLNAVVASMLKMLRRLIGEDIDLAWLPHPDLWTVRIDPSQVDQILANLAVNARDALVGVGKVTIETENVVFDEAYCTDHAGFVPGEYVLLALSDTGAGMSRDVLDHIFEPFFTTKELGKGTGLGLATVYGIVKQNNGFINVYSEPGHGTTFKLYLPRFAGEAAPAPAAGTAAPRAGGTETVLLVEDEEVILNLVKRMLDGLGYTVLTARTPAEAMTVAEGGYAGDIHLLIIDVVMPEMNGRELAERLASKRPGLKCLFMSGYTANVIAHRGVLDEGVHFIHKPFSTAMLAAKVREALERG